MSNGSGVSRGDRNRNARLGRLRELVPVTNAIVGIDLADSKQMVVVTDHDSKVLARRTFRCRAQALGTALDWAAGRAAAKGFGQVTVARAGRAPLAGAGAARGGPGDAVRVQPVLTSWARRTEDLTFDKTDEKDAVLIARLTAQLRCYIPEPAGEVWGRLRHLGARREKLVAETVSQVQQMRDLPGCVWPAALDAARQPFGVPDLVRGDERHPGPGRRGPGPDAPFGRARLESAVRREITRRGGQKPCLRIVRRLFAALSDPAGVVVHRRGALERAQLLISDWRESHRRLADTEARMVAVLDELGLTGLVTSITGLSAVGAATILAETGDLTRFATGRAVVKHSGLAPREKASGSYAGRTKMTGQGRPGLRLAAWRAVWGAQRANPACAARYLHLTSREQNKLTPAQAQAAIAAALLRHLHAVVTTGQRWNPDIAAYGIRGTAKTSIAA